MKKRCYSKYSYIIFFILAFLMLLNIKVKFMKNLKNGLIKIILIYIKASYSNSNYQIKDKEAITREVLITNY